MARIARSESRGGNADGDAEARPRGRPPVISTERLLEVAREVFLEHGIRATTSEVATRAGVAEGTIFHRFKSKEELFHAAMRFDPHEAVAFVETLPGLAGKRPLRATLVGFATRFLELGRTALPAMMMQWSNPEVGLCSGQMGDRAERYRRVVRAISDYFDAEMEGGRIARRNPEVLARMLLGSLHHYCMSELFARDVGTLTLTEFAEEVVDVLLDAGRANVGRARIAARRRRT
jgi:AcrR family transcriptional regulator